MDLSSWPYLLPEYKLEAAIQIPVGSNIKDTISFIPFKEYLNSQFNFTAKSTKSNSSPIWASVNQLNKTLTVDLSKVTSVLDSTDLTLSAQMLTWSLSGDYSRAETQNYVTAFTFTNKIINLVSSNCTYYVVVNLISVFEYQFIDDENDQAVFILNSTENIIGVSSARKSNDTNTMFLYLMAYQLSDAPIDLVVNYTDIYHQSVEFHKSISIQLYIFSVFPPTLDPVSTEVHGDRWSNFTYKLPQISDPQGLNCTAKLDSNTPVWTSMNGNSVVFDTANLSYEIEQSTVITIVIENVEGAWTKYNLTVIVDPIIEPTFGIIRDITVPFGVISQITVNLSSNTEIFAENWYKNQTLSWININKNSSTIFINATNPSNQIIWVKLISFDIWGNKYESNKFNVGFELPNPPTVTNKLGPLVLFVGDEKLFLIPNDLFTSLYNLTYSVSVIHWTIDSYLKSMIQKSTISNETFLYVFGDKAKVCQLSIVASDPSNQSAQATVEVTIK